MTPTRSARTLAAALAAAVTLTGCVQAVIQTQVPEPQRALREPQNRDGILVDDELVRVYWNWAAGNTLRMYVIASRVDVRGKAVYTYSGLLQGYRGGALANHSVALSGLAKARAASAFHVPVKVDAPGAKETWVVFDVVPTWVNGKPVHKILLEAYEADPRPAWIRGELVSPTIVSEIGERTVDGTEKIAFRPFIPWFGGYFSGVELKRGPDGNLLAISAAPWKPTIELVLSGATGDALLPDGSLWGGWIQLERALTDFLVEWKTRSLVEWARGRDVVQLEDAIIAAEKGMLALDRTSRVLKEQADARAREGQRIDPALGERAQLQDQRRTLIGVVVTTLKQARAAQKGAQAPP